MIFRKTDSPTKTGRFERHSTIEAESARRALRARNHLEKKRAKERKRRQRETQQSQPSAPRAFLYRLIAPVALAGGFVAGFFTTTEFVDSVLLRGTALSRVEMEGTAVLSAQTIIRTAGLERGEPLDLIDPQALTDRLEADPWIDTARALRLPDGGLIISVVERSVIARWQTADEAKIVLVDDRGDAFDDQQLSEANALELPLIQGTPDGPALPEEALAILDALKTEPSLLASPADMTLHLPASAGEERGYVLQLGKEGPRALLGQTLFRERVTRLASLLEQVDVELDSSRLIDLRYADRAVLQTAPTSG